MGPTPCPVEACQGKIGFLFPIPFQISHRRSVLGYPCNLCGLVFSDERQLWTNDHGKPAILVSGRIVWQGQEGLVDIE